MDLDMAVEALVDYIEELVAYTCRNCKRSFFAYDDTAEVCPFCGGKDVKVNYNWKVELLNWGFKV